LWPSAAVGTAIGIAAILAVVRPIPRSLGIVAAFSFLLVPMMGTGGPFFPLDSPLWSLFDELLANGLHAAGGARLRTRDLAIVTAVAAFASASVFLADSRFFVGPIRVLYPYCAGVLIYSLNASRRVFPLGRVGAYALVAVMLGCFFLPEVHGLSEAVIRTLFIGVVVPLVVWGGAELRPPRFLVLPCKVIGEASYPLYALHVPIYALVFAGARPTGPSYLAYLAITCGLAVIVGRFYDAPVRRMLLGRIEGRRDRENTIPGKEGVASSSYVPVVRRPDHSGGD
jgi:peptidoglycan/LPS O-acetylase OafA/YrhL